MSIHGDARTGFAQASEYGWCETDRQHKNPKKMRIRNMDGSEREDYFLDPKYRAYTQSFFDQFALPMPTDDMVYRGNSQDLLFLNTLGLVVRTGPMDIIDMIHPGVLQPLYWMPFDNTEHVIALYPGIQLPVHLFDKTMKGTFDKQRASLVHFMTETGQSTIDSRVDQNFGTCANNLIVLDTEDFCFGSRTETLTAYKRQSYQVYRDAELPPYLAIRQTMVEMYGHREVFHERITAYDYHQPLRVIIDDAINEPDAGFRHEALHDFYQICRDAVAGRIPDVALYAPCTGRPEDNQPKMATP